MGPGDERKRGWLRRAAVTACCAIACGGATSPPPRVRLDLPKAPTTARRCAVSEGTTHLLESLRQKVVIDAYVTRGQPKAGAFVDDLRELLQAYKDAGNGRVDYRFIEAGESDDDEHTEARRAANAAGLRTSTFESGKDRRLAEGYLGLVFTCGDEKDAIPLLSPDKDRGVELWITGEIREVSDKAAGVKHRIGLLTGDGEMKLGEPNLVPSAMGKPSMQEVIERNFPFFTFVDVDLAGGDNAVDESLEGLLVLQPARDIPDKALRRIDEFVLKGKSLVVLASSVNVEAHDAAMSATLNAHGLDRLLGGYGIELRKDVVLDFDSTYRVMMATQSGVASVRFPQLPNVVDDPRFTGDARLLDTNFPPFFRVEQVVMPFASSLLLHKDRQPGATKMEIVARSSSKSIRKTGDTVDLAPLQAWKPEGAWGQLDLSARVEGRLTTAFPAGAPGAAGAAQVPAGKSARVFVVSSSQFTANPFARAGNAPEGAAGTKDDEKLLQLAGPYADLQRAGVLLGTIMVTKNTLDWMISDPSLDALGGRAMCAAPASR